MPAGASPNQSRRKRTGRPKGTQARKASKRSINIVTANRKATKAKPRPLRSKRSTSGRGFASMPQAKQREIASQGGRAAHRMGTAHEFSPAEAREAGQKGGKRVSRDRRHMARIGRKGGES